MRSSSPARGRTGRSPVVCRSLYATLRDKFRNSLRFRIAVSLTAFAFLCAVDTSQRMCLFVQIICCFAIFNVDSNQTSATCELPLAITALNLRFEYICRFRVLAGFLFV
jgi:hypothetical protein